MRYDRNRACIPSFGAIFLLATLAGGCAPHLPLENPSPTTVEVSPPPPTEEVDLREPQKEALPAPDVLGRHEREAGLIAGFLGHRYEARGGRLWFVRETGLTPAGVRLVEALGRVDDHALPAPHRFGLVAVDGSVGPLRRLLTNVDSLTPDEVVEIDVLLLRGFIALAGDLSPGAEYDQARTLVALERAAAGAHAMGQVVDTWLPADPTYRGLVAAHRTVRARAPREPAADWSRRPPRRFPRPGDSHPLVAMVRARLWVYGYYPLWSAAVGEGFDESDLLSEEAQRLDVGLREALGHFQYSHGLRSSGLVDGATWQLLSVPPETRLAQIKDALHVLRESDARDKPSFLRVNIPSFEADLFEDYRLVRRFRVVVGSNANVYNTLTGRRGRFNRTPLLTGHMDRVVLNPVWRVPPRIKANTLDRREAENPGYYEEHGFLVRGETVAQLPGPTNPLGRVRFMFDNPYTVFVHDTPDRHTFRARRRALSHGCIRIDDADWLTRHLLEREDHPAKGRVARILALEREHELKLEVGLPIVIEYRMAGLCEEGRVVFYEDIYR